MTFEINKQADWRLVHVPGDQIRSVWPMVKPMLNLLLEACPDADTWIPEDVYHAVKSGTAHLHVACDHACMVLQVLKNPYTGIPYLHVWIAYSRVLGAIAHVLPELERLARSVNADRITCHSPFEAFGAAGFTRKMMIFERSV